MTPADFLTDPLNQQMRLAAAAGWYPGYTSYNPYQSPGANQAAYQTPLLRQGAAAWGGWTGIGYDLTEDLADNWLNPDGTRNPQGNIIARLPVASAAGDFPVIRPTWVGAPVVGGPAGPDYSQRDPGGNPILQGSYAGGNYVFRDQRTGAIRQATGTGSTDPRSMQWNYTTLQPGPGSPAPAVAPPAAPGMTTREIEQYVKRLLSQSTPSTPGNPSPSAPAPSAAVTGGDWRTRSFSPGDFSGSANGGAAFGGGDGGFTPPSGASSGGVDPQTAQWLQQALAAYTRNQAQARTAAQADRERALAAAQQIAGSFGNNAQSQQLQQLISQLAQNPYGPQWQSQAAAQQSEERSRQLAAAEETMRAQYAQMGRPVDPAALAMLRNAVAQQGNADLRNLQIQSAGGALQGTQAATSALSDYVNNQARYAALAQQSLIDILGSTNYDYGASDLMTMLQLGQAAALAPAQSYGTQYNPYPGYNSYWR